MEIKSNQHFQFHKRIILVFIGVVLCLIATRETCYSYDEKPSLLVIRAESKDFKDSMNGLKGELESDFFIHELFYSDQLTVEDIQKKIESVSPKIVVLMDNKSIALYKKYQTAYAAPGHEIPSVSIMGVFMNLAIKGIDNATGISYEVPVVTSIVSLRAALGKKLSEVGIIHRDILRDFVTANKAYCSKEGVDIISYEIPSDENIAKNVKKCLKKLEKEHRVDAIWIPNDNSLLTPSILQDVWFPFSRKFRKPIIVGVDVLVNPKFNFGTFAVIPDHKSLGMQAAEKVFEIMENNWQVDSSAIDPPTSVYKIINFQQISDWYGIREDQVNNVDKILK